MDTIQDEDVHKHAPVTVAAFLDDLGPDVVDLREVERIILVRPGGEQPDSEQRRKRRAYACPNEFLSFHGLEKLCFKNNNYYPGVFLPIILGIIPSSDRFVGTA